MKAITNLISTAILIFAEHYKKILITLATVILLVWLYLHWQSFAVVTTLIVCVGIILGVLHVVFEWERFSSSITAWAKNIENKKEVDKFDVPISIKVLEEPTKEFDFTSNVPSTYSWR